MVQRRQFTTASGEPWMVYEVRRAASNGGRREVLPADFATGWLSFQSATEKRRLAPAPTGWEKLSDAALRELLARAEPVSTSLRFSGLTQPSHTRPTERPEEHRSA